MNDWNEFEEVNNKYLWWSLVIWIGGLILGLIFLGFIFFLIYLALDAI